VEPGGILLVHTSFRSVAPVTDGPQGLIEALHEALGPRGTLVMPSMASDDDHVFDATHTPCPDMGIVAETFWRMPGVMRSDSPHAFAARGPLAARLLAPHPIDVPHGLDSPVGRIYELDGQVMLLGVGHDANTTIHLAESLAEVRYRRPKHATVLAGGAPTRIDYGEIDHCCENFSMVGDWLAEQGLQRAGTVGNAQALLMRSRNVVRVVTEKLRENMIMFLHAEGYDDQCDEARASIPDAP
jgi:aminoglycoside 3-N-acetyltransferase